MRTQRGLDKRATIIHRVGGKLSLPERGASLAVTHSVGQILCISLSFPLFIYLLI